MSDTDYDGRGCIKLLGAIIREWVRDARYREAELDALAEFCDLSRKMLCDRLTTSPYFRNPTVTKK